MPLSCTCNRFPTWACHRFPTSLCDHNVFYVSRSEVEHTRTGRCLTVAPRTLVLPRHPRHMLRSFFDYVVYARANGNPLLDSNAWGAITKEDLDEYRINHYSTFRQNRSRRPRLLWHCNFQIGSSKIGLNVNLVWPRY
jgi:hypothetical protein